jgi:hypothetical protein
MRPSGHELLRNSPTLWACNLHRLPLRVLWFYVVVAVVTIVLWYRVPSIDHDLEVLIFVFLLFVSAVGVGVVVEQYSDIPNDEYIPTPGHVHAMAFAVRFVALFLILAAPLAVAWFRILVGRDRPNVFEISRLNECNELLYVLGAAPCLPESPEDTGRLVASGLLSLGQIEQAVAASQVSRQPDELIGRINIVLLHNANQAGASSAQPVGAGVPDYGRLVVSKIKNAAAHSLARLLRQEPTPNVLNLSPRDYAIDIALVSAFASFLVAVEGAEGLVAVVTLCIHPMFIFIIVFMLGAVAFLLLPLPDLDLRWTQSHTAALAKTYGHLVFLIYYYVILGVIFAVCAVQLARRPHLKKTALAYSFTISYPSIPILTAFVLDLTGLKILGFTGYHFRVVGVILTLLYLILFGYFRREGERIRALPGSYIPTGHNL